MTGRTDTTTAKRRVKIALNEDEVRLLYALAVRDVEDCPLAHIDGGIAGPHAEHEDAGLSALAKLSGAVLDLQDGGMRTCHQCGRTGMRGFTVHPAKTVTVGDASVRLDAHVECTSKTACRRRWPKRLPEEYI